MKVYKGTDRNRRCKGLQYEIGKTVELERESETGQAQEENAQDTGDESRDRTEH